MNHKIRIYVSERTKDNEISLSLNFPMVYISRGTAVAQWLRCCATDRKVAGSIPAGVIGIFH